MGKVFERYLRSVRFLFYTKSFTKNQLFYMLFYEAFVKILFNLFFLFWDLQKFVFFLKNSLNQLMQGGYNRSYILKQTFLVASWLENVRHFITTRQLKGQVTILKSLKIFFEIFLTSNETFSYTSVILYRDKILLTFLKTNGQTTLNHSTDLECKLIY